MASLRYVFLVGLMALGGGCARPRSASPAPPTLSPAPPSAPPPEYFPTYSQQGWQLLSPPPGAAIAGPVPPEMRNTSTNYCVMPHGCAVANLYVRKPSSAYRLTAQMMDRPDAARVNTIGSCTNVTELNRYLVAEGAKPWPSVPLPDGTEHLHCLMARPGRVLVELWGRDISRDEPSPSGTIVMRQYERLARLHVIAN